MVKELLSVYDNYVTPYVEMDQELAEEAESFYEEFKGVADYVRELVHTGENTVRGFVIVILWINLDPALLRPGRFDRFIEVPLPNIDGRREILKIHTKNMSLDDEADVDLLAELTDDLSGADLKAVCTEAGMFAIREKRDKITVTDFMDAIDKVMSKSKEDELFKTEAGVMFG